MAEQSKRPKKPAATSGKSNKNKSARSYTVRMGDSLSRIASRNGTTVKNICRLNGITSSTTLRPGQKLKLK